MKNNGRKIERPLEEQVVKLATKLYPQSYGWSDAIVKARSELTGERYVPPPHIRRQEENHR